MFGLLFAQKGARVCRKCHVIMREGKALRNLPVSHADWLGESTHVARYFGEKITERGHTMSYTGPAVQVPVWKCPQCGHSIAR